MSIKKILNKGSLIALAVTLLLISTISVAKTRVTIDGSINIDFGRNKNNDRNRRNDYWDSNYDAVGDITDYKYLLKPFVLNGKGYSVLKQNGRLYILQVDFINGNVNRVEKERIYKAKIFSSNCLAIDGDSRYCLTITSEGSPALWDRQLGKIKHTGRWLKNNYGYDYYYDSNQDWFEW